MIPGGGFRRMHSEQASGAWQCALAGDRLSLSVSGHMRGRTQGRDAVPRCPDSDAVNMLI